MIEDWQREEWAKHSPWRLTGQAIPAWLAERDQFVWQRPPARYFDGERFASVPGGSGVYVLFASEQDEESLLYVGKATQLSQRVWTHWKQRRIPFTHAGWIEVPVEAAEVLEAYMIGELEPPMNEKFCPRMEAWHRAVADALGEG